MQKVTHKKLMLFSLVFPGVAIFLFAILVPLIYSLYLGMTDSVGYSNGDFVAFDNYRKILIEDKVFWNSLLNAFLLAAGLIFIQHPLSMTFAILLDKIEGTAEKFFRALIFVPCVISIVVTTQMWKGIFDADFGPLNKLLETLGMASLQRAWLSEPKTAIACIVVITMWQGFGWALLLYYAGVKGIPVELYEAAKIDGATGIKATLAITFPLMRPVIRVNVTLALLSALKMMETVYLTTGGGPGDSTQFIASYFYTKAFSTQEYGYANAISIVFVLICLLVTFINNKVIKSEAIEF